MTISGVGEGEGDDTAAIKVSCIVVVWSNKENTGKRDQKWNRMAGIFVELITASNLQTTAESIFHREKEMELSLSSGKGQHNLEPDDSEVLGYSGEGLGKRGGLGVWGFGEGGVMGVLGAMNGLFC